MRSRPVPRNFISGELAPWLDGIMNDLTRQGARTLENVLVKKRGAVTQRPGTYFVAETKDSTKASVLVPVSIDDDNHYVLEIGDAYIRFYKNHQRITYSGTTTIYEVTSPWSAGDASSVRWQYIGKDKSLMLFHNLYNPYALKWIADATWSMGIHNIIASPYILALEKTGRIFKSVDGEVWIQDRIDVAQGSAANYIDLSYGAGMFLAVTGDTATEKKIVKSDSEAELWVQVTPSDITWPYGVALNAAGEMLAIGRTSGQIYSSEDGSTFTARTVPVSAGIYYGGYYSKDDAAWRVTGQNVNAYSVDGITWTTIASGTFSSYIDKLRYANQKWVGVGAYAQSSLSYGCIAYAASLTAAWVMGYSSTYTWRDAAYGTPGGASLWVAVGDSGQIRSSSGATSWLSVAPFTSKNLKAVIWAHHKYYVFGDGSDYWVSDDGVTFTSQTFTANAGSLTIRAAVASDSYDYQWLDASGTFPGVGTYHEGRLALSKLRDKPNQIYGSEIGNTKHFYLGDYSDDAWMYEVGMDRNTDIQWLMGGLGGLVVGTRTAEGVLLGSPSEGITPNTAQFRWLSTFGSDSVQPVRVGNMVVFVQRGGEIVRGYIPNENAFQSPELTEYADHVTKGGVREIDHQEDPQNIVYFVRNDGQLLALTMDQGVRAWSRYVTDGTVESVAVIPTSGVEDEVWAIVNRTIGGSAKRYVEYFAPIATGSAVSAHYVDCGVNTTSAVTMGIVGGMTHLSGEIVDALINGTRVVSGITVPASGTITVSPYSGTNIHAGLPYSATIQTMRGDYGSPYGDGTGFNKRTSEILVWVHDSMAVANFGPTPSMISEPIQYSQSAALNTEVARINFPGTWDRDGYIWCVVRDPRPFTMVALSTDNETGDR